MLVWPAMVRAQDLPVPVIRFKTFAPYLHGNPDTLYVIHFWATWCAPCRKELPAFEKINDQYTGQKVKVLLVSLDFPSQRNKSLMPFIRSNQIRAQVVLLNEPDANSWIDRVSKDWSGALPATLIYKGDHRLFFDKELSYNELNNCILSFKP
jgi:thiol-disulfide isomerase/thioredoxin